MSLPVQTPLGINVLGGLLSNSGLIQNQNFTNLIGTSNGLGNYTSGSFVGSNLALSKIISVLNAASAVIGNLPITSLSVSTLQNLLNLGSTMPVLALGTTGLNDYLIPCSKTDATGIITCSTTEFFTTNSPIYFQGTLDPSLSSTSFYWVKTIIDSTSFTISTTPGGPVFALMGGLYDMSITSVDWVKNGWIGKLAFYAFSSWFADISTILTQFSIADAWIQQQNSTIWSTSNSLNYLDGVYSNMNDLITSDISGINLSLPQFGQDLIALGRAIDLSTIQSFGLPSNLLQVLANNRAQTDAVNLALMASGLSLIEIKAFTDFPTKVNIFQQQKIYNAFTAIRSVDLDDVCLLLNCRTDGLESLADLLNPRKMFPLSWNSLTVPLWNTQAGPTNSKTYYPIYVNDGVNTMLSSKVAKSQVGYRIPKNIDVESFYDPTSPEFRVLEEGFDSYLRGILPADIAMAAGALSWSFMQITNIEQNDIEKFAQIAANLEITSGLSEIAGTSVPVNSSLASVALSKIALGTGPNGTYTMADFFGAVSGTNYQLGSIVDELATINTSALSNIYDSITSILLAAPSLAGYDADLTPLIAAANLEIINISSQNSLLTNKINSVWAESVNNLSKSITIRLKAFRDFTADEQEEPETQISWINSLRDWSVKTEPNGTAQTIESISDVSTVTGQSIIGLMRQIRNEARLNLVGIPSNLYIPGEPSRAQQSAYISNTPTNSDGKALGELRDDKYIVTDTKYGAPRVVLDGSAVEGSFGGSPYQEIIPPELNVLYTSAQLSTNTYSVDEAIEEVEKCNCTCWAP